MSRAMREMSPFEFECSLSELRRDVQLSNVQTLWQAKTKRSDWLWMTPTFNCVRTLARIDATCCDGMSYCVCVSAAHGNKLCFSYKSMGLVRLLLRYWVYELFICCQKWFLIFLLFLSDRQSNASVLMLHESARENLRCVTGILHCYFAIRVESKLISCNQRWASVEKRLQWACKRRTWSNWNDTPTLSTNCIFVQN